MFEVLNESGTERLQSESFNTVMQWLVRRSMELAEWEDITWFAASADLVDDMLYMHASRAGWYKIRRI
jgi:hypothetical protein